MVRLSITLSGTFCSSDGSNTLDTSGHSMLSDCYHNIVCKDTFLLTIARIAEAHLSHVSSDHSPYDLIADMAHAMSMLGNRRLTMAWSSTTAVTVIIVPPGHPVSIIQRIILSASYSIMPAVL